MHKNWTDYRNNSTIQMMKIIKMWQTIISLVLINRNKWVLNYQILTLKLKLIPINNNSVKWPNSKIIIKIQIVKNSNNRNNKSKNKNKTNRNN